MRDAEAPLGLSQLVTGRLTRRGRQVRLARAPEIRQFWVTKQRGGDGSPIAARIRLLTSESNHESGVIARDADWRSSIRLAVAWVRLLAPAAQAEVFDAAVDAVRQGGRRRGTNISVLDVHHPDIDAFITAKREPQRLQSFKFECRGG